MKTILRNILAVVIGIVAGSAINMAIVVVGPQFITPPPGVDMSKTESIRASMHLFEPKHFAIPFLAHALGTLTGALAAYLIAASRRPVIAFVVGGFFLFGGVAASMMVPAPKWFIALDLVAAYLPMALIAVRIGQGIKGDAVAATG